MHYKRKGDRVDDVLHNIVLDHVNRLEQENKSLREALEFYANAENHDDVKKYCENCTYSAIDYDNGAIARQALKGEQHEPSTD